MKGAVALALLSIAAAAQPPAPVVSSGLDRLVEQSCAPLRGKRVGVVTNQTAVDQRGRHLVDLLLAAEGVEVVALFSPEHGFDGVLDAKVKDARHASGLPIHSLYGETRKPRPEMLRGLDLLLFDIQDVGCRFYTYVSTMGLAMEAAAEARIGFVVLDRPNPLGGVVVAGPVLEPGLESFTGHHRLPVRHGMTVGELAKMFVRERRLDLDLQVVTMRGWRRDSFFHDTGLRWVDPSPNMRSPLQALLYPGIGLLEFTNLSVGRGTDTPFELIGAPWLENTALVARLRAAGLAGVGFVAIDFTPTASRFAGVRCAGVRFLVTDWQTFRPLRLGFELACALRDLQPRAWEGDAWRKLLANDSLFRTFTDGASAADLATACESGLAGFRERRAAFLLY